tara:strand:- start:620 stop:1366 length:747 start_codon:yes stop_codon:yes gene_type:complete
MIDQVIVSADNNPFYIDNWAMVARCWAMVGFNPVLAWITDDASRYDELAACGDVHVFNQDPDIPVENLAMVSRFLLAQSLPGISMLSDADMMPINCNYFRSAAKLYQPGTVLSMSSDAYSQWASKDLHPICYLIADQITWRGLINPHGLDNGRLIETWKRPHGIDDKDALDRSPFADESLLQWMLKHWAGSVIGIKRGWINGRALGRIDRARWEWDELTAKSGAYIDAHLPHPVTKEHKVEALESFVK